MINLRISSVFSPVLTLSFFLLLSVPGLKAQDNPHQLLWKISSAESSKVSYLYGTMHLQDDRVFNISDSLLPAIKRSEVFALELHPDSLEVWINEESDELFPENIYRKILSEEEYARLDAKFIEVNGIPLDDFYSFDPDSVEAALTNFETGENDMPNFLDGYLYSMAYQYGSEIIGLEKVEDQLTDPETIDEDEIKESILELIDTSDEEMESMIEEMITLYNTGDIKGIFEYVEKYDQIDEVMVRRNNVMLNSMLKTMKSKSLFAAVGAAHLPGDDGLITLLRNSGYTVEPVAVTFNNKDNYQEYEPNLDEWEVNSFKKFGLEVMTPNSPEGYSEDGMIMNYTTDLLSGLTYVFMLSDEIPMGIISPKTIEAFMTTYFSEEGEDVEFLDQKEVEINGQSFYEAVIKDSDDGLIRFAIATESETFALLMIESTYKGLYSKSANAFFNSVKLFEAEENPKYTGEWRTYTDAKAGFSVDIPDVEIEDMDRIVENPIDPEGDPYYMHIDFVSDPDLEYNFLIRYNDQPPGYFLVDQEEIIESLGDELAAGIELVGDPEPFEENGVKGFMAYLSFYGVYNGVFKFYFRGNRSYALMAQAKEKNFEVDLNSRFFTSFKLEPLQEEEIEEFEYNDLFTVDFPAKPKLFLEEEGDPGDEFESSKTFAGTSEFTGGLYMLEARKLSPLYRTLDINEYLEQTVNDVLEYQDSIVKLEAINVEGYPAVRAHIVNPRSNVQQYIQTMYIDDHLVQLLACLGIEEVERGMVETFMDSFDYTRKKAKMDIRASKVSEITALLRSSDTTEVKIGQTALLFHDFDENDIQALIDALPYEPVMNYGFEDRKDDLIGPITKLGDADDMKSLLDFYKQETTSDRVKEEIVSSLLSFQDVDADKTLIDLLLTDPPGRSDEYFYAFYQLEDSLDIMKKYPRQLAQLYKNDNFKDQLVSIYTDKFMAEEDLRDQFKELRTLITEDILNQITRYRDTTIRNSNFYLNESLMYNYLAIAESDPSVDVPTSGKILEAIYTPYEKDPWIKTQALIQAMQMGFEVEGDIISDYMDPLYSRYEIMEALVNAEISDLIPARYLEADAYTELSVYNYVGDYVGGYNNSVEKLGELNVDGVTYGAYKISSLEEDEYYSFTPILCIAVLKAPDMEEFDPNTVYSDFEDMKSAWKLQARSLIRQYQRELIDMD